MADGPEACARVKCVYRSDCGFGRHERRTDGLARVNAYAGPRGRVLSGAARGHHGGDEEEDLHAVVQQSFSFGDSSNCWIEPTGKEQLCSNDRGFSGDGYSGGWSVAPQYAHIRIRIIRMRVSRRCMQHGGDARVARIVARPSQHSAHPHVWGCDSERGCGIS